MIAAVVFDLDGVLIDSEQVWDGVREELAHERGGRWHPGAQRAMMGMSSPEWSRYMHDEIGLARAARGDQPHRRRAHARALRRRAALDPGRARGGRAGWPPRFPLGLASSSNRELIDAVLAAGGIARALRGGRLLRGGRAGQAGARRLPRGGAPAGPRPGRLRRGRGLPQRHPLGQGGRHGLHRDPEPALPAGRGARARPTSCCRTSPTWTLDRRAVDGAAARRRRGSRPRRGRSPARARRCALAARATALASISCAAIETATSSGVRAPIGIPTGACRRTSSASPTPSSRSRAVRSARVFSLPIAPMKPAVGAERELERGDVELEVVGHHADRRARVDRGALEEPVGPLVGELVGVGEALAGQEHPARVADRDAVAEQLAERDERRDVVAGAEEVEVGARGVGLDEDLARRRRSRRSPLSPSSSSDARAARRPSSPFGPASSSSTIACSPKRALVEPQRDRDRAVGADGLGDGRDEPRVEPVDGDGDPAAAVEADVEAVLVVEPVRSAAARATRRAPRSPRGSPRARRSRR